MKRSTTKILIHIVKFNVLTLPCIDFTKGNKSTKLDISVLQSCHDNNISLNLYYFFATKTKCGNVVTRGGGVKGTAGDQTLAAY